MSQSQKNVFDVAIKSLITVIFSMCAYFLYNIAEKVESTSVSVIRLETWAISIERRLDNIETTMQPSHK